mmetsp:Transcript_17274/g.35593  ORF Transcript_17274/g.35593 Transcript_17274/m.35593 type:complete len:244 (-) Transcript_17274:550-1281(-)
MLRPLFSKLLNSQLGLLDHLPELLLVALPISHHIDQLLLHLVLSLSLVELLLSLLCGIIVLPLHALHRLHVLSVLFTFLDDLPELFLESLEFSLSLLFLFRLLLLPPALLVLLSLNFLAFRRACDSDCSPLLPIFDLIAEGISSNCRLPFPVAPSQDALDHVLERGLLCGASETLDEPLPDGAGKEVRVQGVHLPRVVPLPILELLFPRLLCQLPPVGVYDSGIDKASSVSDLCARVLHRLHD